MQSQSLRSPSLLDRACAPFHRAIDPIGWLERTLRKYGNLVKLGEKQFLIADPEDAWSVLSGSHHDFHRAYDFLKDASRFWGGGSMVVSHGDAWARRRRCVQKPFLPSRLAPHRPEVPRVGAEAIDRWPDQTSDLMPFLFDVCMKAAARTVLGVPELAESEEVRGSLQATMALLEEAHHLEISADTDRKSEFRNKLAGMDALLLETIQSRRASQPCRNAPGLLDALISEKDASGAPLSPEAIRGEMATALRAAYKNSAITLGWTLLLLSRHMELQEALAEELSGCRSGSEDGLRSLPLLNSVLQESMRLYPLYPTLVRQARSSLRIRESEFPADSTYTVSVWSLHRDRRWFDRPAEFKPDRWHGNLESRLPKCVYIPFGFGPRKCHAEEYGMMEMRTLLALIVSRYRVRLAPGASLRPLLTLNGLRPEKLPMILERRR